MLIFHVNSIFISNFMLPQAVPHLGMTRYKYTNGVSLSGNRCYHVWRPALPCLVTSVPLFSDNCSPVPPSVTSVPQFGDRCSLVPLFSDSCSPVLWPLFCSLTAVPPLGDLCFPSSVTSVLLYDHRSAVG